MRLVPALALALALFGCGRDDGAPAAGRAPWLGADVRACLHAAGAVEASDAGDLAFYRDDQADGLVDRSGVFFAREFLASAFEPSARPDPVAAPYVVYVLRTWKSAAAGGEPDPIEALGTDAAVWFLQPGAASGRRTVEACFAEEV